MRYRLRWKQSALGELAEIWTMASSQDRRAITTAVQAIESELANAAIEAGESRSGDERIVFEAPVAVIFEVDRRKMEVRVLQIWRY